MTMTYYGATQATTLANPPVMLMENVAGQVPYGGALSTRAMGQTVWFYSSTNAASDVATAGAITDGGALGMFPGDMLLGVMNGGAASTNAACYMGMLNSTNSSLATAAYNLTSCYSTGSS